MALKGSLKHKPFHNAEILSTEKLFSLDSAMAFCSLKEVMLNSHWYSSGLGQIGLSDTTAVRILGSMDQGSFPKQS